MFAVLFDLEGQLDCTLHETKAGADLEAARLSEKYAAESANYSASVAVQEVRLPAPIKAPGDVFSTLADGLDASTDGRGWTAEHERARLLANAAPAMLAALHKLDGWLSGYGTKDRREIHGELRAFLAEIGMPSFVMGGAPTASASARWAYFAARDGETARGEVTAPDHGEARRLSFHEIARAFRMQAELDAAACGEDWDHFAAELDGYEIGLATPTAQPAGSIGEAVRELPELGRFCLQDYRSLANGLRETIDAGRLSAADLPNDFDWIESKLSYLSYHDKGAGSFEPLSELRRRYPMEGEG